jgi:hypothetical protein
MSRLGVYAMPMGRGAMTAYEKELRDDAAIYFPPLRDYVVQTAEKNGCLLIWPS